MCGSPNSWCACVAAWQNQPALDALVVQHPSCSLPMFQPHFPAHARSFFLAHAPTQVRTHTLTHEHALHVHTYARTYARTYAHTYTHTYTRTHIRTHARTHARTHTRTQSITLTLHVHTVVGSAGLSSNHKFLLLFLCIITLVTGEMCNAHLHAHITTVSLCACTQKYTHAFNLSETHAHEFCCLQLLCFEQNIGTSDTLTHTYHMRINTQTHRNEYPHTHTYHACQLTRFP